MTTIAYDGRVVAADRLFTYGQLQLRRPAQKLRLSATKPYLYGLTGLSAWFDVWIEWFEKGANPSAIPHFYGDNDETGNFLAFPLQELGKCYSFTRMMPYACPIYEPMAWGSGDDFALAAMDCGRSAPEAIGVAARRDRGTGHGVLAFDLERRIWLGGEISHDADAEGAGDSGAPAEVAGGEGAEASAEHVAWPGPRELPEDRRFVPRDAGGAEGAPGDRARDRSGPIELENAAMLGEGVEVFGRVQAWEQGVVTAVYAQDCAVDAEIRRDGQKFKEARIPHESTVQVSGRKWRHRR